MHCTCVELQYAVVHWVLFIVSTGEKTLTTATPGALIPGKTNSPRADAI